MSPGFKRQWPPNIAAPNIYLSAVPCRVPSAQRRANRPPVGIFEYPVEEAKPVLTVRQGYEYARGRRFRQ